MTELTVMTKEQVEEAKDKKPTSIKEVVALLDDLREEMEIRFEGLVKFKDDLLNVTRRVNSCEIDLNRMKNPATFEAKEIKHAPRKHVLNVNGEQVETWA